ncbi:MAG: GNAT family N-acetyltransferase [Anaerolineales bacterium]|nr:GNAT family N-acetyltransferase [Anaerolineales bacterium]
MDIQFIQDVTSFQLMREEWDSLLVGAVSNIPFLRHGYLSNWWETRGGGEWEHAELWIAVGKQDGQIRAIAPLFLSGSEKEAPGLWFLGSIEISDYLDFIVAPEDVDAFALDLLHALAAQGLQSGTFLDLFNLPLSSPTISALTQAAEILGWGVAVTELQPCPTVPLPDTWETFLGSLVKKQRHEIRRKMRRGEEHGLTFHILEDESRFEVTLEEILEVMKMDPGKNAFLTPIMQDQFRRSLGAAFSEGWLQVASLRAGKDLAAAYLNFDYANKLWVYNSALNPAYASLSAGWVLLGGLIQWGIQNRRTELDFMRGGEQYKYRFGGKDRKILRVRIERTR